MTRLGIVVALPPEARCLVNRRIRTGERADVAGEGWVQLCGIGAKRAHRAAQSLLEAGATALVSWGIAGGLDVTLLPGSLVLPKTIIASDGSVCRVDANWHTRVCRCLEGHVVSSNAPLVESRSVVKDATEKATLFQRSGAVAVDMESAAIGTVAQGAGVPFMVIRAVADSASRSMPSAIVDRIDASGRLRLQALARTVLRRPSALTDLLRLYRDTRAACATLTKVVKLTGPDLLAN